MPFVWVVQLLGVASPVLVVTVVRTTFGLMASPPLAKVRWRTAIPTRHGLNVVPGLLSGDCSGETTVVEKKDVLSVPEAAKFLGCTDVWVIKLLNAGQLAGFKLNGRAWVVDRKSAEKNLREYNERDPALAGRKRSKLA